MLEQFIVGSLPRKLAIHKSDSKSLQLFTGVVIKAIASSLLTEKLSSYQSLDCMCLGTFDIEQ